MVSQNNGCSQNLNGADFSLLLKVISMNKLVIAGIITIIMGLAAVYLYTVSPIYHSSVMLQVHPESNSLTALKDISELLIDQHVKVYDELEILKSRRIIGRVVSELKLDVSVEPNHFPVIGSAFARRYKGDEPSKPIFGLKRYAWGGESINVVSFSTDSDHEGKDFRLVAIDDQRYELYDDNGKFLLNGVINQFYNLNASQIQIEVSELNARENTEFSIIKHNLKEVVKKYRNIVRVKEKRRGSGIIELSLNGDDKERITKFLNVAANEYVNRSVENRIQDIERMISFISSQLPVVKANLDTAELDLDAYNKKYGGIDINLETRTLLSRLAEIEKQSSDLELLKVDYKRKYTSQHPQLVILEKQLEQLNNERIETKRRIQMLPEAELEVIRVMRQVKTASEVYALLLKKSQELNIAKAGIAGNARIIDPAIVPVNPVKPKIIKTAIITFFLSLFISFFIAAARYFIRDYYHNYIDLSNIIEKDYQLPVYPVLYSKAQSKFNKKVMKKRDVHSMSLAHAIPNDEAIEGLRNIQTNLHFEIQNSGKKVIAITSTTPEAGKSFLTLNLSYMFAFMGKKVAVIDADIRRGCLHLYYNKECYPGLSDIISGSVDTENAVREINITSEKINNGGALQFIPSGSPVLNTADSLVSKKFTALLDKMKASADYIFIDTPPVIHLADALIIARYADYNILVVDINKDSLNDIKNTLKRCYQSNIGLFAVIFNKIQPNPENGYAYYQRYKNYRK